MVGLRWSLRLSGVASTVILARLLTPHDFGIVAIAMLFVGLVETLGDTGERLALIRLRVLERGHYDTAFSLQLLIGFAVALFLYGLAPLAPRYFNEPDAVAVIQLLSLRAILSGLENIGTVDFRRDFRFGAAYTLSMLAKIASLLATLVIAVLTRSYWSLVAGILINQAAMTILSYVMHPYRPRLSLARWREICGFSGWTLLRSLAIYLTTQLDKIAVGGFAPAGSVGRYAVAMDVASSPTAEIHDPLVGVLYPVFSKCQQDRAAVRSLFLRVFGWSVLICAATAAGLACIAADYTLLLLGPQWSGVERLVPWLALAASLSCLSGATDPLFDTLGMPAWSARLQWLRCLLLAAALISAALLWRTLEAIAIARVAAILACLPLILIAASRALGLSAGVYWPLLWRPVLSALLMSAALIALRATLPESAGLRLLLEIPAGVLAYTASIFLLWWIAARPEGPEADAAGRMRAALRAIRHRFPARGLGAL
jgi:O-antigen/teichoic acid export membrane protein